MIKIKKQTYVAFIFLFIFWGTVKADELAFSPVDFGVLNATNGVERYYALLACHQQAILTGGRVTYKGIDSLYLEIPQSAGGIPLTENTDFCNVVLSVKNNAQDMYLFTMIKPLMSVLLTAKEVDSGVFINNAMLSRGSYIISVKDKNPWVPERVGYGSSHIRRDILFVENGIAKNSVIMPYDNSQSRIECAFRKVTKKEKKFLNLHFFRIPESTHKTCLLRVVGENNLIVKNVSVHTPEDNVLYGDHIFLIEDCTNFILEDVIIEGTYSQSDKYGYAFGLNNVWNHKALRVTAMGKWGVYGNNNINTAFLEDCEVNRFDIHCYGKDVTCKNTIFRNLYNQFSSFYGNLVFKNCSFVLFVPVLLESSYSSYTHFNILFRDCYIKIDSQRPYLINAGKLKSNILARQEMRRVEWPNIKMQSVTIDLDHPIKEFSIFHVSSGNETVFGLESIVLNRVKFKNMIPPCVISNRAVSFNKSVANSVKRCNFGISFHN